MKKSIQAGLLLALLVLPALIVGFLHFFGKNEYRLEVFDPRAPNCPTPPDGQTHTIPPFRFVNQRGETVTQEDYEGKIYVADFFFTRCDNICIRMSSELLRVQKEFEDNPTVQILSHSVDPVHDSAAVLQTYAELYKANPDTWTFVTGEKDEIYEIARCGYFVAAKPKEQVEDDFIHQDWFVLVDKEGRIRGKYSGTRKEDVDKLINEIYVLLQEYDD